MTPVTWSTYDGVRDDVAPWLREVPAEWRFEKAKWFLSYCKQLNDHGTIDNVLSLTLRGVVNNDPDNPEGLVPKDYRTYQVFEAGDLVFKLIDLENVRTSRVGLVHERGIMSSAYIRVVPSAQWNPRFLYYFYFHLYEAEVFNKIGSGVRSTLGQADLLDLPIPVIGRDIQDKIVGFLDEKCAKVDEAVRIKEEQIALLRERRQILIQEAVTRGLNPDVPMKDSGIDWVGEIPMHWDVSPLLAEARIKSVTNKPDLPLLSVYLGLGVVKFDDVEEKRTNATSLDLSNYQLTEPGDLVLNNQQAWRGSVGVSFETGIVSPAYIVLKLSDRFDPEFANLYFRASTTVSHYLINSKGVGTIQRNLYWPRLKRAPVTIPPLEEQRKIVGFVNSECEGIDHGISIKESQIAALKEYKSTLINAAVTGKIKVA